MLNNLVEESDTPELVKKFLGTCTEYIEQGILAGISDEDKIESLLTYYMEIRGPFVSQYVNEIFKEDKDIEAEVRYKIMEMSLLNVLSKYFSIKISKSLKFIKSNLD